MIHELKIKDEYLDNLISGKKKFEIRYNDRDYQLDDTLMFERWGIQYLFGITHIHSGLGLENGYIIMSVYYMNNSELGDKNNE